MLSCTTCGRHYPPGVEFCPYDQTALQADVTVVGEPPADPLIGQVLNGKYRIEERLGIGGMGTVYRARHVLIDRPVALKVLNQRLVKDDAARIRFQREAKAAGRLQHINAVAVTDFGQTTDGYVYIVMELLEGRTLREILAKEAPLETARAVSLMLQTAAAVEAAHQAGIIHRDLKPANILVTQRSDVPAMVKVLDFGIAKVFVEDPEDEEDSKTLTQVGAMIGTPRYMSPEQCIGHTLTPASDVYSLGVILYEMLTGMSPFSGSTPLAIAVKHASELPRPPREILSTIPPELERVVMHALEKRPEDRPSDAGVFRSELLATAEVLKLEHAAVSIVPDLEMLRSAGVESPSGRLVIDIARLRESGLISSGSNELTVIGGGNSSAQAAPAVPAIPKKSFPRVDVPVQRHRSLPRFVLAGVVLVMLLLAGVAFYARRSHVDPAPVAVNANSSPSPIESPSPSPTPTASPVHRPTPKPEPKKKESKVSSFVNKLKRILKKPF